ncbi:hypothetical protein [Nocardia alni]|uniref:hypothetical protein n=1 Tax=Nocardia alni TaxID=2815723 RepID=UPI001C2122B3|nr:hypothetical protein [Nocardia alni]
MYGAWDFLSMIGWDVMALGQSLADMVGDLMGLGSSGGGGLGASFPPGQYPLG